MAGGFVILDFLMKVRTQKLNARLVLKQIASATSEVQKGKKSRRYTFVRIGENVYKVSHV